MLKIDDSRTARAKYVDHPLFEKCIEIWCPVGWISYLDQIVKEVEKYNSTCEEINHIAFAQVKVKFGLLTVYYQPFLDQEIVDASGGAMQKAYEAGLHGFINSVCREAREHCTLCGSKLTEMVIDSKIKKVCWDHMPKDKYIYDGKS